MGIVFLVLGIGSRKMIRIVFHYDMNNPFALIMAGIVAATIYSESFSIFYRVGREAFCALLVLCIAILIFCLSDIRVLFSKAEKYFAERKIILIFFLIVIAAVVVLGGYLTSQVPVGYDTENYHAASIRWIEEYGAVKGLGNLHTRFAYNSSFLCLQALFSFSWIYKMSLHSMNGFLWVYFVIFCIATLKFREERRLVLSDILRILFVVILFRYEETARIMSPATDFMPMCLVAYIFIRWCDLNEKNEQSYVPYGLLSVLGLFNMSVKLSGVACALFAIKPAIDMIRHRRYIDILKFIVLGLITVAPFLGRNILISGYLFYPIASLDLFNFDWEIPKSVVVTDNVMIKVFARSWGESYAYSDINLDFMDWFKIWIEESTRYFDILCVVDIALSIGAFVFTAWSMLRKKVLQYDLIVLFMAAFGVLFLIVSAPSARFGRWWFWVLPAVLVYYLFAGTARPASAGAVRPVREQSGGIMSNRMTAAIVLSLVFVSIMFAYYVSFWIRNEGTKTATTPEANYFLSFDPYDYSNEDATAKYVEMNGIKFYYYSPDGGFNSYTGFPGTEVASLLERIEMRGTSLKDGFRPRGEYVNEPYDFQGRLLSEDEVAMLGLQKYYPASKG